VRLVGTWVALHLLLGACAPSSETTARPHVFALSSVVAHQQRNLTTDLISVPERVGPDSLDYGWQLELAGPERAHHGLIVRRLGRMRIFSADADLAVIEAELGLAASAGPDRVRVRVLLNQQLLGLVMVERGWSTHRLAVPPGRVRKGLNVLELLPGPGSVGDNPLLRVRRIRLRSGSGRPVWPQRPDRIRARGDGSDAVVEMPTGSFLDMVLRVPSHSRLSGKFTIESASGGTFEPVGVAVRLLDEQLSEHTLLSELFEETSTRPQDLAAELGRWSNQLVRLRWSVDGSGNALIRWHGVVVQLADASILPLPNRPIERAAPDHSGRLGRPDVIILLLDAARADAFSPFGGLHPTPAVEALAADGTRFADARASSSWTGQSLAGLLTGLYPDAQGFAAFGSRLPAAIPTLAELLVSAGYRTVLWSQHPIYETNTTLRRGFEEVYMRRGSMDALPGAPQLLSEEKPTLVLVHLVPPHAPYTPPAPFRGSYSSWYTGDPEGDGRLLDRAAHGRRVSPAEVRYWHDRYLENVAFADELVGRVIKTLRQSGRYDDALVVLLSDHGEAFFEHGRFNHAHTVSRELLHVPLVIKWPSGVARFRATVEEPVILLDLVPTLVDGLSLGGVGGQFQGRSLLPAAFDGRRTDRDLYALTRGASRGLTPPRPHVMLESGGWRLMYEPLKDRGALYRVDRDPLERNDLASEQPLLTLLLRQRLLIQSALNRRVSRESGASPGEGGDLDPQLAERLEALGYLN